MLFFKKKEIVENPYPVDKEALRQFLPKFGVRSMEVLEGFYTMVLEATVVEGKRLHYLSRDQINLTKTPFSAIRKKEKRELKVFKFPEKHEVVRLVDTLVVTYKLGPLKWAIISKMDDFDALVKLCKPEVEFYGDLLHRDQSGIFLTPEDAVKAFLEEYGRQ